MSVNVWIGLGTNLGDRLQNLKAALDALKELMTIRKLSSIYETDPWGYTDQPSFLNQVVEISTDLPPTNLLALLKKLERNLGREKTFHLGPRVIDLDILFYADMVCETPQLVIPHPHMPQRAFVLVPLAEIAPGLIHPALKRSVKELLADVETSGVHYVCSPDEIPG